MKESFRRRGIVVLIFTLVLSVFPVSPAYAASFTTAIQSRFVDAILEFGKEPYEFNRYALHDFDGDGIPEILMGVANIQNPLFCNYAVLKYDAPGNRFVMMGSIAESRYLMRDRYSNALIGFYQGTVSGYNFKIYRNYYIANANLSRNTPLAHLGGSNNNTVYDGANISSGYYINDISVSSSRFDEEELNYRGSYDEVIVHDGAGFHYEVATIAVRSWRPVVINKRPILFLSTDNFTKTWQMPIYELIIEKLGPANTRIDDWAANQTIVKENYQRFALYDIDGDGAPELFLAVMRDEKLSYDVYRYWNGDMQFIGSFDAYSKYLAKAPGGVFAFDPVPNRLYEQAAKKVSFVNNMLISDTLLQSYYRNNRYVYLNANLAGVSHSSYVSSLVNYVNSYAEIKTFDVDMVPPSAALIMYVKTKAFTVQ